jgi:hypothetical protein
MLRYSILMNRLRMTCILKKKKCNPKAIDEHSPSAYIIKVCNQPYCEYIPDVRYGRCCCIALVDFVEIIEIFRSLAFTVHLRHLGVGIELNQLVSPAQVANGRNSFLAVVV